MSEGKHANKINLNLEETGILNKLEKSIKCTYVALVKERCDGVAQKLITSHTHRQKRNKQKQ